MAFGCTDMARLDFFLKNVPIYFYEVLFLATQFKIPGIFFIVSWIGLYM